MEQTNRTILFETLNPQKADLLTMIGDVKGKESLSDSDVDEIHAALAVHSFQEMIQTFDPSVYMLLNTESGKAEFSYRNVPQQEMECHCIDLHNDSSLLSVLLHLMDAKRKRKYVLENFNAVLGDLIQKDRKDDFVKQRNEVIQHVKRGEREKAKQELEALIKEQDNGFSLLTIFLNEVYTEVFCCSHFSERDRFLSDSSASSLVTVLSIAENLKRRGLQLEEKQKADLEQLMEECLAQSGCKNPTLLRQLLQLPNINSDEEVEALQEQYERYLELYSRIIKLFWTMVKPLLEQLLGIREFFAQYAETEEGMQPTLVIANFELALLQNELNRQKLRLYLETVNQKYMHKDMLWFAIVPRIQYHSVEKDRPLRERFSGNAEKIQYPVNEEQAVTLVLEILAAYRIITFMSPQLSEQTCFAGVRDRGIDDWLTTLEAYGGLEKPEYIVPCFPNFTIVPKEHAQLTLGNTTAYDAVKAQVRIQGSKKVWLDGIGVEAAYITAGLFAACQCPRYLENRFHARVDPETPGVAYRITQEGNSRLTPTTMAREILYFPKHLYEDIDRKGQGVFLVPHEGGIIVYTDRTMAFQKGAKDRIYSVQTLTYIERVVRFMTQDFKENLIVRFFQNRAGSIKMKWLENKKNVNSLFQEGEELDYKIDKDNNTCTFTIHFNDNVKGETVHITK